MRGKSEDNDIRWGEHCVKEFHQKWQGELEDFARDSSFKRLHHSDSFAKLNLLLPLKSLKNPTLYFP